MDIPRKKIMHRSVCARLVVWLCLCDMLVSLGASVLGRCLFRRRARGGVVVPGFASPHR